MRLLVRMMIPTEAGNKSSRDSNFLENIVGFMEDMKAAAAYFLEMDSRRTGYSLWKCHV
jgi:hypothetical protein